MADQLAVISRWLSKQHVVSYCVAQDNVPWCANAFYLYDPEAVAFYLLSETTTRHGKMAGEFARVAGTVSGQPKNIALIRGVQFQGDLRLLHGDEANARYEDYCKKFPVARMRRAPVWEIALSELKFTDNTLGFGNKHIWLRD
ncbi:UPF0306 protein [Salmonella enterica subsp. enterica serovar Choleraesuis]|nr:UPF0306 protein [Salmonella enterica subsp. enterica serovar Choleraesuis]